MSELIKCLANHVCPSFEGQLTFILCLRPLSQTFIYPKQSVSFEFTSFLLFSLLLFTNMPEKTKICRKQVLSGLGIFHPEDTEITVIAGRNTYQLLPSYVIHPADNGAWTANDYVWRLVGKDGNNENKKILTRSKFPAPTFLPQIHKYSDWWLKVEDEVEDELVVMVGGQKLVDGVFVWRPMQSR